MQWHSTPYTNHMSLPRRSRIVRVVCDTCGGEQDQPLHALRMSQRIDGTEVRAERVLDGWHLLQPQALAPLLDQPNEERLGFVHAARDVVALHMDSKNGTHVERPMPTQFTAYTDVPRVPAHRVSAGNIRKKGLGWRHSRARGRPVAALRGRETWA